MALSGTIYGTFSGVGTSVARPYLSWSATQSISGNYSDVTVTAYYVKYNSSWGSYNASHSTTLTINGNGNTGNYGFDLRPVGTAPVTDEIRSRTVRVYHNADGTKSCSLSYSGTTGTSLGNGSVSGTITLDTIPREAYVTNSVSFELEDDIPLTLSNAGNQYVQSLLYVNGTLIKTTNHGQVTSATITLNSTQIDNCYAEIPNATSCSMYVRIKTYSDSGYSTQIGSNKDKTGTMTIDQTANKPTFTTYTLENVDKTVDNTDKYSNTLVSSSTSTLLGTSSDKMILGISKIRAVITSANKMVALNSATADKYRFICDGQYSEEDYDASSTVNIDIDNANSGSVSVTAYDSRSLTTTVNDTFGTIAEYEDVNLWGMTLVRDNNVDSEVTLSFSGSYFDEYFGGGTSGVQNDFHIAWRYKETTDSWGAQTWTDITADVTDTSGSLSFSDYIEGDLGASGFDTEKSYNIEVRLYDKLTNIIIEGTLDRGIPVIDITQDGIAINGKYDTTEGGELQVYGQSIGRLASYGNGLYGNAIINGNFDIWQRGTSKSSDGYLADRWYQYDNGCTLTVTRQSFTVGQTDVPNNPIYYLRTSTSGNDDAGDESNLSQKIEDVRTFAGQTISGSFWVKADANCNIAIEFRQVFGSGGSSTIDAIGVNKFPVTTSWSKVEFTADIPSISGKTIGTSSYLHLQFFLGAGSNYDSRTDSLGNQNRQIDIAQVQLNAGSQALPFCPRSYAEELALCQRYYQKSLRGYDLAVYGVGTGYTVGLVLFPVQMRVAPTLTITSGGGTANRVYIGGVNKTFTSTIYADSFSVILSEGSGLVGNCQFNWIADAEL